jgi:V/A-type H+-transporting ATPase subunit D
VAEVKYTKSELRSQQVKLGQLQKYLPTLQLKKALLQSEINEVRIKIVLLEDVYKTQKQKLDDASALLSDVTTISPEEAAQIVEVHRSHENIAGVDIPQYKGITFSPINYTLIDSPPWIDSIILLMRKTIEATVEVSIVREQLAALEKELREVSIRVNLFEKILIPRTISTIKRIKIFLSDQQLAAVARAKVAKKKITMQRIEDHQKLTAEI